MIKKIFIQMLRLKRKSFFEEKTFRQKGFTLTEVLVVLTIMTVILSILLSTFYNLDSYRALEGDVAEIRSFLEEARMYTQGSREDSSYGVYFAEKGITLFRGESWEEKVEELKDHNFNMYVSVDTVGVGSDEIVFKRLFGEPTVSGNLLVSSRGREITVTILSSGLME